MAIIAELHLHGDIILFEETFDLAPGAEGTFEDVHYVTTEDDGTHYVFFWWVSDTRFSTFEGALDADPTVNGHRVIAEIDDRRLYRIRTRSFPPDQSLVFPTFREYDVTTIETRRNANGLHLKARFPNRDALESFVESARDIARHVDAKRLYTDDRATHDESTLTRKQREALSLALDRGYFDTPSKATLADLASERDVTAQTLSDHIRVGVKKLIENAVSSKPSKENSDSM